MSAHRADEFEPAGRPVRWYELALLVIAELLAAAALGDAPPLLAQAAHNRTVELAAIISFGLVLVISLWKLLVPPRLSATRGAFILIGLISIYLLIRG